MLGFIIIIAAVSLIIYFALKRAKNKVEFNYAEAEENIKEALKKLQAEEEEAMAPETTPTIVVEEKVKPPTMSSKKKKKSNNR